MSKLGLLGIVVVIALPAARASGQVRLGEEFLVNTNTLGAQVSPAIASDSDGNFVIVWESIEAGDIHVFGRRYDAAGTPLGEGAFQVSSYEGAGASVTSGPQGQFVVAWTRFAQDYDGVDVLARRYDGSGAPQGNELLVNTYTSRYQFVPAISSDANGNFVIVWMSQGEDGSGDGVFGRRYDALGNPRGDPFQVNSYTTGNQSDPAVASAADGKFVVVWERHGYYGHVGVYGQRYDATGARIGGEFSVTPVSFDTRYFADPAVASNAAGDFVVVWVRHLSESDTVIRGQRYAAGGGLQGPGFQVNTPIGGRDRVPAVASDAAGNFVVVWTRGNGDSSDDFDTYGQRFDASGLRRGAQFRVNTDTIGNQHGSAVAAGAEGQFVVIWMAPDGNATGVFGQRFAEDVIFTDGFESGTSSPGLRP